jgi:predicted O-methyltransferase YrrM
MASRLPYPQDHATHLPILIGLGVMLPIKSVFEFGAGLYSTTAFLNRDVYPLVDRFTSLESDLSWAQRVLDAVPGDDRIQFINSTEHYAPSEYDLVFVDNGPEQHKIETIRNMAMDLAPNGLYVIHDAEHVPYADEIKKFTHSWFFYGFNPSTAIASTAGFSDPQHVAIQAIEQKIAANAHVDPTDVKRWKEIMRG